MRITIRIAATAIVLAAVVLMSAACPKKTPPQKTPDVLYNEGMYYMSKGKGGDFLNPPDYEKARGTFQQILFEHPTSRYTPMAELRIADTYYEAGDYLTSADQYDLWWRHHLGRPELPYAIYRTAMSYYHLMLSKDRDQTYTRLASINFRYLIENFPDNEYTLAIGEKTSLLDVRLASHEMYIGKFYFRHNRWWSAVDRFQVVLDEYSRRGFDEEAMLYQWKSYRHLGRFEEADAVYHRMVEKFPKGKFTRQAGEIEATQKTKGAESWFKP